MAADEKRATGDDEPTLRAIALLGAQVAKFTVDMTTHPSCPIKGRPEQLSVAVGACIQAAQFIMQGCGMPVERIAACFRDAADQMTDGRGEEQGQVWLAGKMAREARAKGQVT